jgi:hypothetical protein
LTLSHQNLGQLSPQTRSAVLGNVWTKILFGVSEEDAHILAQLIGLGAIDPEAVKHAAQTQTQHPLYAPLSEQWYVWATLLANQQPRQAIVRDQQGRTRQVWTEALPVYTPTPMTFDRLRQHALSRYAVVRDDPARAAPPLVGESWPSYDPISVEPPEPPP